MDLEIGLETQSDFIVLADCLIVPIRFDLYDDLVRHLQSSLLNKLKHSDLLGIILDVSSIMIIDNENIKILCNLCEMTILMGKETVIVGFQPGVASALADLPEVKLQKLVTAINVEQAIKYLKQAAKSKQEKKYA